jgi:hypothetical protein
MTPEPTTSSTTQARNGRRSGGLRTGTRAARGARVRRRALVAALGLAVLAAVVPVSPAHADQLPDLPDFPGLPHDAVDPTDHSGPLLAPDLPDFPDQLANSTENPAPPTPPVDNPSPSGDSIPAPQRIDAGFGGVATGSHQAAGVALIAAAILLGLLVVVIARHQRAEAESSR